MWLIIKWTWVAQPLSQSWWGFHSLTRSAPWAHCLVPAPFSFLPELSVHMSTRARAGGQWCSCSGHPHAHRRAHTPWRGHPHSAPAWQCHRGRRCLHGCIFQVIQMTQSSEILWESSWFLNAGNENSKSFNLLCNNSKTHPPTLGLR